MGTHAHGSAAGAAKDLRASPSGDGAAALPHASFGAFASHSLCIHGIPFSLWSVRFNIAAVCV